MRMTVRVATSSAVAAQLVTSRQSPQRRIIGRSPLRVAAYTRRSEKTSHCMPTLTSESLIRLP